MEGGWTFLRIIPINHARNEKERKDYLSVIVAIHRHCHPFSVRCRIAAFFSSSSFLFFSFLFTGVAASLLLFHGVLTNDSPPTTASEWRSCAHQVLIIGPGRAEIETRLPCLLHVCR